MKSFVIHTFLLFAFAIFVADIAEAAKIRGSSTSSSSELPGDEEFSVAHKRQRGLRENPKRSLQASGFSSSPSPLPTKGENYDPSKVEPTKKDKMKTALQERRTGKLDKLAVQRFPLARGIQNRVAERMKKMSGFQGRTPDKLKTKKPTKKIADAANKVNGQTGGRDGTKVGSFNGVINGSPNVKYGQISRIGLNQLKRGKSAKR